MVPLLAINFYFWRMLYHAVAALCSLPPVAYFLLFLTCLAIVALDELDHRLGMVRAAHEWCAKVCRQVRCIRSPDQLSDCVHDTQIMCPVRRAARELNSVGRRVYGQVYGACIVAFTKHILRLDVMASLRVEVLRQFKRTKELEAQLAAKDDALRTREQEYAALHQAKEHLQNRLAAKVKLADTLLRELRRVQAAIASNEQVRGDSHCDLQFRRCADTMGTQSALPSSDLATCR